MGVPPTAIQPPMLADAEAMGRGWIGLQEWLEWLWLAAEVLREQWWCRAYQDHQQEKQEVYRRAVERGWQWSFSSSSSASRGCTGSQAGNSSGNRSSSHETAGGRCRGSEALTTFQNPREETRPTQHGEALSAETPPLTGEEGRGEGEKEPHKGRGKPQRGVTRVRAGQGEQGPGGHAWT